MLECVFGKKIFEKKTFGLSENFKILATTRYKLYDFLGQFYEYDVI